MDATLFKHPIATYQVMAEQSNTRAEEILNLGHTSESMKRVAIDMKDVPKSFLSTEGDDQYDAEPEESSSEDDADVPNWVYGVGFQIGDINREVVAQYMRAIAEPHNDDPFKIQLLTFYKDNLRLHKLQMLTLKHEMGGIRGETEQIKHETKKILDDRLPLGDITRIKFRLVKEDVYSNKINSLEARVEKMEDNIAKILQNQATQTAMLQQLLNTNTNVHSLDANKKGETDVEVHEPVTEKITGEGDVTAALRKKKMLEISSTSSQATSQGEQSSALIAVNA